MPVIYFEEKSVNIFKLLAVFEFYCNFCSFQISEKKEIPKFVRKMENLETVEKKTVKFEVEVTGKPKPHVTW